MNAMKCLSWKCLAMPSFPWSWRDHGKAVTFHGFDRWAVRAKISFSYIWVSVTVAKNTTPFLVFIWFICWFLVYGLIMIAMILAVGKQDRLSYDSSLYLHQCFTYTSEKPVNLENFVFVTSPLMVFLVPYVSCHLRPFFQQVMKSILFSRYSHKFFFYVWFLIVYLEISATIYDKRILRFIRSNKWRS